MRMPRRRIAAGSVRRTVPSGRSGVLGAVRFAVLRSVAVPAVAGVLAGLSVAVAVAVAAGPAAAQSARSADGPADASAAAPRVALETSLGTITLELYPNEAPETVDNFLRYVKAGYYDGTIFHRVIDEFMIQGGGYTPDLRLKTPLYPAVHLEARNGLRNTRGTVAMARSKDPDSATSQFFINVVDNPFLDYSPSTNPTGYAVFGRVVEGMDVVDAIRSVDTVENPADVQPDGSYAHSLPVQEVVVQSARIQGAEAGGR